MTQERIQDWLQIAGLYGVVASLVFVGLQMEQTGRIAYSAKYQARANNSIAVTSAPLSSDSLLRAITKSEKGARCL